MHALRAICNAFHAPELCLQTNNEEEQPAPPVEKGAELPPVLISETEKASDISCAGNVLMTGVLRLAGVQVMRCKVHGRVTKEIKIECAAARQMVTAL